MKNIVICIAALFLNIVWGTTSHAFDKEAFCQKERTKYHKFLASIQDLSPSKQIVMLDTFLHLDEDADACYTSALREYVQENEMDLVQIDAGKVQIPPEKILTCYELTAEYGCHHLQPDDTVSTRDFQVHTTPVPLSISTLKLKTEWEGVNAKLLGIFRIEPDGKPKPIRHTKNGFKRPKDQTWIFAIYQIDAPMKFRKYVWNIHSTDQF